MIYPNGVPQYLVLNDIWFYQICIKLMSNVEISQYHKNFIKLFHDYEKDVITHQELLKEDDKLLMEYAEKEKLYTIQNKEEFCKSISGWGRKK